MTHPGSSPGPPTMTPSPNSVVRIFEQARRVSGRWLRRWSNAESLEPASDAAQEWLDSKDSEDDDAVAEARDRLLTALDESHTWPRP